jgi:hypothetical protein
LTIGVDDEDVTVQMMSASADGSLDVRAMADLEIRIKLGGASGKSFRLFGRAPRHR